MPELDALVAAISALEQQRGLLSDAVVDAAIGPMRVRLAQLRDPVAPGQSLRQVSVLFLDVVGSTTLSAQLDPEDLHEVIDHALALCTARVRAHDGRVLQYAGDSLLAAFGTEGAQEDDAERAVACGLALLEEGRAMGARVQRDHGHAGCDVRVGIHTGTVLLGGGVDDDGSIRGMAVNIAARMEQTAPAGALRISHDTWLLVRGAFELDAQEPLWVKGGAEPLRTYLVRRELPQALRTAARGLQGTQQPLVGRQAQQDRLRALPGLAARHQRLMAMTLIGEPGVGKSRLLQALQQDLGSTPGGGALLLGRAYPQTRLQPYGLLRNLLAWRLRLPDSAPMAQAKQHFAQGLVPGLRGSDDERLAQAQALGQLIGLDFSDGPALQGLSPAALRDRGFAALRNHLRTLGEGSAPPLLLLEDLHWADDGSLDFVSELLADAAAAPLAMVATARPELLERRPAWAGLGTGPAGPPGHELLLLEALDGANARVLAASLLQGVQGSEALQDQLVALADGNPFYMEELVRMCLDQGVIGSGDQGWRLLPERLRQAQLPTSLVGVLQARLDALPAEERRALQQASIVGHVFWDDALKALDSEALSALPGLYRRLLVQQRPLSSFEDTHEEAFRHHVLQQVAYDTVLRPARAAGHAAAATWLAQRMGDRPAEFLAITAEHYRRAGQATQAADFYERAASDAARRFANSAALEYAASALECVPATDLRRRYALHRLREAAADVVGQRSLQQAEIEAALAMATELGDETLLARSTMSLALLASRRGDEAQAMALAERAAGLAARAGDSETAAMAQAQRAWSQYTLGHGEEAIRLAQDAVQHARQAVAQSGTAARRILRIKSLNVLGIVSLGEGAFSAARAILGEALEQAIAEDQRLAQASVLLNLASIDHDTGRYGKALEGYERALAHARSLDLRITEAAVLYNMGNCHRVLARADLAWSYAEQAEVIAAAAEMREIVARSWLLRGHLRADAGEAEEGHACYDRAAVDFEACGLAHFASQAYAGRAALALDADDLPAALDWAERTAQAIAGLAWLTGIEAPSWPSLVCHRVWQRLGDGRAQAALERAHRELMRIADRAGDAALRQGILYDIPLHREVLAAWEARATATPPAGPK